MDISFCKECHNMLYPKEDKQQQTQFMSCRTCEYFEPSKTHIITHIKINHSSMTTMSSLSKDLVCDKTLPRTNVVICPKCNSSEAVYFQTKDRQEEALTIYFVCCVCETMWANNKMQ